MAKVELEEASRGPTQANLPSMPACEHVLNATRWAARSARLCHCETVTREY